MPKELKQCNMCKKHKRTVTEKVSRNRLIFGGFRGNSFELRCDACETIVCKQIEKHLTNLLK